MKLKGITSLCVGLVAVLPLLAQAQTPNRGPAQGIKAERERLQRLERAYVSAKQAFEKDRGNATKRRAYIDRTVAFGTATMNSPALPPRTKYPRALRLYREALKLDPRNREALANKKMIEDIYRQMGKPIPT